MAAITASRYEVVHTMRPLRVLTLVRQGLEPPDSLEGFSEKEIDQWKVEYDVVVTLRGLGHTVQVLGVFDDLAPIRQQIHEFRPHIVFMLLEEFHGVGTYDHAVVSYLELMKQRYTGCNPMGLFLAHDKALSKKVLTYHRVPTPKFAVFPMRRKIRMPKRLSFPLLVKSATEDASLGISQASIVRDPDALIERVRFIHESIHSDALVEQYIEGRELYVGIMGNKQLKSFPPWEMLFTKMPDDVARIATAKVKWDSKYQQKHGITTGPAEGLTGNQVRRISRLCKRVYRSLNLSGYARMDLRMTDDGRFHVIEANANPNLEYGEDFAESAEKVGISYEQLIQKIINLGLSYRAPWQGH